MKKIFCVILISALTMGIFGACNQTPAEQPAPPQAPQATPTPATPAAPQAAPEAPAPVAEGPTGSITIAIPTEPVSLIPARHNSTPTIPFMFLTHNRLFQQHHETFEPMPYLVSEWQALSDTLFEFTIHEGILFHNGEEMTAEDVVASWYFVRETPDARGVHTSAVGIEQTGTHTVVIDTGEPNATFLVDLASHGNSILPASLINSGHDFGVQPVGSGPFVFEEWRAGDHLRYRAFEDYWNTDRIATIAEVTYRVIPEGSSRTIALETGEVDFIEAVALPDVGRLQADASFTVSMIDSPALNIINLNHQRPQFENVYARRAIQMAIDNEVIVAAAYDGFGLPTRSQFPIVFAGATYNGVMPFDPEGAMALLAEHNIDPASLNFEIIACNEGFRRAAEIVQAQLSEIGIAVSINQMDAAARFSTVTEGNFEAAFGPWGAGWLESILRAQFIGEGGLVSRNHMNNPELSELLLTGFGTIDHDARIAIYEEASRVANEYVVLIPSHLDVTIRAFNANITAPELSGLSTIWNVNRISWN